MCNTYIFIHVRSLFLPFFFCHLNCMQKYQSIEASVFNSAVFFSLLFIWLSKQLIYLTLKVDAVEHQLILSFSFLMLYANSNEINKNNIIRVMIYKAIKKLKNRNILMFAHVIICRSSLKLTLVFRKCFSSTQKGMKIEITCL